MESANDGGTRPRIGLDEIGVSSDVFTGIETVNSNKSIFITSNNGSILTISHSADIQILDMLGKVVGTKSNSTEIQLESIPTGIYFIKIKQRFIVSL
jgi:hypothetical protein